MRALRRFLLIGCIGALLLAACVVADELPEPGVVVIKTGALTAAELAEIAAITNGLMAERAAVNS